MCISLKLIEKLGSLIKMLPVTIEMDYKEIAKRERFRQIEDERKKRIFNCKQRLIGIDQEALKKQIQEKKDRERAEKLEDDLFNKKRERDMLVVNQIEKQKIEDRKAALRNLNHYRTHYQRFEDRREFDLNDPASYKKTCNIDPEGSRFGLSSMMNFDGLEDPSGSRLKIQAEQQQVWLQQQIQEKHRQLQEQKKAELAHEEAEIARNQRYRALKDMEDKCKREMQAKVADFNKALIVQKLQARMEEMKSDLADSNQHIYNALTSDFLTENKETSDSALGNGRINGAMYRGMSQAQRNEIKETQLRQISEQKARQREEAMEEQAWNDYQMNIQKTIRAMDIKQQDKLKEIDDALRQENKKLWEDHKMRNTYLERYVYTNMPTDEYFDQFNKGTR